MILGREKQSQLVTSSSSVMGLEIAEVVRLGGTRARHRL